MRGIESASGTACTALPWKNRRNATLELLQRRASLWGEALLKMRKDQKVNFRPSWICRESVRVLRIEAVEGTRAPKSLKSRIPSSVDPGRLKFARLNRLKASALNWRLVPSVNAVFFTTAKSKFARPG